MEKSSRRPLISAKVDLRGFPYMPLEVGRLRDSDIVTLATPEAFKSAVLLWCAAWHQVPAGSLPNDDRLLAKYAGFGDNINAWVIVRTSSMRGFLLASDNRYYHPVICANAMRAWQSKLADIKRTKAATAARKKKQRDERRHD